MNQNAEQDTVTQDELAKSVAGLMALLESESPETVPTTSEGDEGMQKGMAHAVMPTLGGHAALAGAPPLDPQLDMTMAEPEGELDMDDDDKDHLAQMFLDANTDEDEPMGKSLVQDNAAEQDDADDEFAKSLADAFINNEALAEAAQASEFAKSLVIGTIEGLSIANEEMQKSFNSFESRQDAKIRVLAKGIAAIAKAVGEIRAEVVAVSNAPSRTVAKSARVLEKSFNRDEGTPDLSKAMVLKALERRAEQGKVDAFTIAKYETSGMLDPMLAREIQSELGS